MGKGSKKALVSVDYASLSIPKLKQHCREAGISEKGGKLGLVARLERRCVAPAAFVAPKIAKRAKSASSMILNEVDVANMPDRALELTTAELARRSAFKELKNSYTQRCRKVRKEKGAILSCFDKWYFTRLRLTAASSTAADPLLLGAGSAADREAAERVLVAALAAQGFSGGDAAAVGGWLTKQHARVSAELDSSLRRLGGGVAAPAGEVSVRAQPSKPSRLDVTCGDVVLQIQASQLERLRTLHAQTLAASASAGTGTTPGSDTTPPGADTTTPFLHAVLRLLLRYQSLGGGGFQCALPTPVFECLSELWGVSCEGFASPLNSHFASYFSAYPDTDAAFGSLGSFFDERSSRALRSGSFELNPPFCVALYADLYARCSKLLDRAERKGKALSFAIVVGATEPSLAHESLEMLGASPYLRGRLQVSVAEHVYNCATALDEQARSGAAGTFRACDTGIYFLQSGAGAKRWPVSDAKLAKLHAAFRVTNGKKRPASEEPGR